MPLVGIFFDDPAFDGYPFADPSYYKAYHQLAEVLWNKGATAVIVRDAATYVSGNTFRGGWMWSAEDKQYHRTDEPVETDVIYHKGQWLKPDASCVIVNPIEFERLCTDKWLTYQRFPAYFPRTALLNSAEDLQKAQSEFTASKLVAKPLNEERGNGVVVGEREKVLSSIQSFPYLLQEMIDTTKGIPGIVEGMHDLRIISIAGEMITSYVRTPPPGSMVANVSAGGSWFGISIPKLPKSAQDMFHAIDAELSNFPQRVYSTDMGLDADGTWKLFELNSKPALSERDSHEGANEFMDKLADVLIAAGRK